MEEDSIFLGQISQVLARIQDCSAEVDGQVDCHSLGNGDSVDLNCLLSNSRGTVQDTTRCHKHYEKS